MKKILKGLPGHLESEGRLRPTGGESIDYLLMSFPFACHLSCLKCFSWSTRVHRDLPVAARKKALAESVKLGASVLVIPGEGEPLLYPGWRELVDLASDLGMVSIIFTNAVGLDEAAARFAFARDVSFILSLDSLRPETYALLTGRAGRFERVRGNIEILRDVYRPAIGKNGAKIVTRLGLNTVVCLPNLEEAAELKEWCGDEVVFVANTPVYEGRAKEHWRALTGMADGESNPSLVERAKELSETGGPTSARPDKMCAYLYNGLTVDSDGEVMICPDARATRGLIGNIADSSLADLNARVKSLTAKAGVPCIVRAPSLYADLLSSLKKS
jgi:MoaA/NifB/PqqE/SkfB family radical SAM enzyme